MRPTPARVLLSALVVAALAAGLLTSQVIFFAVALGAGFLLGTSLSTTRNPLAHALLRFRGSEVKVRVWGAPPPLLTSGAPAILTSVNVLGAGVHVFFRVSGRRSFHLKVAQPRDLQFSPGNVVVGAARYVQWDGKKLRAVAGVPALSVALDEQRRRRS